MGSYHGERVTACAPCPYNWMDTEVVVVSGASWNPCGHALLRVGGYYFHIGGFNGYPYRLDEQGFTRYLHEEGKHEVRRTQIRLRRPSRAQAKLEELASRTWGWGVLPHNCIAFVEDVLAAGGCPDASISNCPILEPWGHRRGTPGAARR